MSRFSGKKIFLTGAASGMGRASALQFAAEGAHLYCVDLNGDGAEQTAADIRTAGGQAMAAALDVSDQEACQAAVEAGAAALGGLDVLANIAGLGGIRRLEEETADRWSLVFGVNVDGPFFLSQAALPHLLSSKGNIINVASTAGLTGHAYMSAYVASKHALVGLTKTMALEFGRRGLRVNAVCPGGTKTAFLQGFQIDETMEMDLIMRAGLVEHMAEAEDIAKTICFVASDDADFMNGSAISVDGGAVAG